MWLVDSWRGHARSGFDVEISYFGHSERSESGHKYFAERTALAAWCDVLMVTVAGGEQTHGTVDAAVLEALGDKAWLFNASRGTTVCMWLPCWTP